MTLVAGVDSSTQACKVVVRDAASGELRREGRAPHPDGTEVDPAAWWRALQAAAEDAGGLDDVAAVGVGAQQHGMVCLDDAGQVVRPALLWNDTRSAAAAADLVAEGGGPRAWAEAAGTVPVASFTVTKLRWLADHEPAAAGRVAAVCLPHDWLTWRLAGAAAWSRWPPTGATPAAPATGRRPPGPTGPTCSGSPSGPTPWSRPCSTRPPARERRPAGAVLAPGTGDNMAAALGLGARPGDVVVSVGTSGTVFAVSERPAADPTGAVAGFADATGRFLPLVCTLNAARVLDAAAAMLGVDHRRLSELALGAPAGAGGLTLVPYLEGERTPNRPHATGALHGLRLANSTPACLARAAVEGLLCGLADGLDALVRRGRRGAAGAADRRRGPLGGAAPDRPGGVRRTRCVVPPPGEYVADGAARQAAWVLRRGRAAPTGSRPAPAPTRRTRPRRSASATPPAASSPLDQAERDKDAASPETIAPDR